MRCRGIAVRRRACAASPIGGSPIKVDRRVGDLHRGGLSSRARAAGLSQRGDLWLLMGARLASLGGVTTTALRAASGPLPTENIFLSRPTRCRAASRQGPSFFKHFGLGANRGSRSPHRGWASEGHRHLSRSGRCSAHLRLHGAPKIALYRNDQRLRGRPRRETGTYLRRGAHPPTPRGGERAAVVVSRSSKAGGSGGGQAEARRRRRYGRKRPPPRATPVAASGDTGTSKGRKPVQGTALQEKNGVRALMRFAQVVIDSGERSDCATTATVRASLGTSSV